MEKKETYKEMNFIRKREYDNIVKNIRKIKPESGDSFVVNMKSTMIRVTPYVKYPDMYTLLFLYDSKSIEYPFVKDIDNDIVDYIERGIHQVKNLKE